MIQLADKYVRSSTRPCAMFFELKITKNVEIRLKVMEKTGFPWEYNFYSRRCGFMYNYWLAKF